MHTGLLCSDSSANVPLERKVTDAAKAYVRRFGKQPDTCYVHPGELPNGEYAVGGVLLKASARTLRFHYWIGVEKDADSVSAEDAHPDRQGQPTLFDLA